MRRVRHSQTTRTARPAHLRRRQGTRALPHLLRQAQSQPRQPMLPLVASQQVQLPGLSSALWSVWRCYFWLAASLVVGARHGGWTRLDGTHDIGPCRQKSWESTNKRTCRVRWRAHHLRLCTSCRQGMSLRWIGRWSRWKSEMKRAGRRACVPFNRL